MRTSANLVEARRSVKSRAVAPQLTATTLGTLGFEVDGTPLPIGSRKAKAVLACLMLGEKAEETRERLVGLFWSEAPEENARASLRQVVHELRHAFRSRGFDGFTADKKKIALDTKRIAVDLKEIVAAADAGLPHDGMVKTDRLADTLLDGFDSIDPAFGSWLQAKRQTLHDRLIRGLEGGLRSTQNTALCEALANAIIHLDRTHEEACRVLITARADRGDFGGALRLYKGLWDLLETEFDIEPSSDTQSLVVDIRSRMTVTDQAVAFRGEPRPEVPGTANHASNVVPLPLFDAPVVRPAPRNMILTIGPFDAAGAEADKRHVIQGFRHELVASLVRFREWYVRDDTMGAAGPGREDVASEYRVDATPLAGPDGIRIVLTLRDVHSGTYVWSDRYEISLANWFHAQQAVIRRIAAALNVHLSASRLNRLSNLPDVSLDVFDRWLRAQAMIRTFNAREWPRAAEIFRSIIAEAPNFSPGYSSLVQMQNVAHIVHPGIFRNAAVEREALELARAAAQLDGVDSRAQLCLGWSHAMSRHYDNAELHMGLAAELNENDPWTLISTALFHSFVEQHDRAEAQCKRAGEVAGAVSRLHWVYQSTMEFLRGDYERCITSGIHSGDAIVSNIAWRAAAHWHVGQAEQARASLQKFFAAARQQWNGGNQPAERDMIRWLLHLYPIRDARNWGRLRDGLAAAGADVAGIQHDIW
jgi:DNA-binding SARP family transcriptional activator/TolB-like protein